MWNNFFNQLLSIKVRQGPIDRWLLLLSAGLLGFGLIMLSSASSVIAYETHQDAYYFFKRQIVFAVIGVMAFWIASRIPYQFWKKLALPALILSVILLVALFLPGLGKVANGSRSWLNLGFVTFQPTELIKLLFIVYLSAWFAKHRSAGHSAHSDSLIPFLAIFSLIAILILLQPDLGTLIIISGAAFTVFFISGAPVRNILLICLLALIALAGLVSVSEHQQKRFHCVLDASYDPKGACYQVNQSLIAIGSGGLFGRGIGNSRQKYLNIPEVHNDFIFAVIAEEIGFIFCALLLSGFFVLFAKGFAIAKNSTDEFAKNLATGITAWLAIQTILNIGGIINILPMTGIPLPLISYGGSALISSLFALGVLASISRQQKYG